MKTRFPYRLWRWTAFDENLFDLARDEVELFTLIAREAE